MLAWCAPGYGWHFGLPGLLPNVQLAVPESPDNFLQDGSQLWSFNTQNVLRQQQKSNQNIMKLVKFHGKLALKILALFLDCLLLDF